MSDYTSMVRGIFRVSAAITATLMVGSVALAGTGDADTSFGGDGLVTVGAQPSIEDQASASVVQPDGKIIVVGYAEESPTSVDGLIVRLRANGNLDGRFGRGSPYRLSAGIVRINWPGQSEGFEAVAVAPDGSIVAAGFSEGTSRIDGLVVRLTPKGAMDMSFGGDGIVRIELGTSIQFTDAAVQHDGRVVVAGLIDTSSGKSAVLVRLTRTGELDTSFGGGDGWVESDPSLVAVGIVPRLVIQPGGRIVLAHTRQSGPGGESVLRRYTSTGVLDVGFGTDGVATPPEHAPGAATVVVDIGIQPDGKIVIAGAVVDPTSTSYCSAPPFIHYLGRLTKNGDVDTTFGAGTGAVVPSLSAYTVPLSVAVQSDGKVVMSGQRCDDSRGATSYVTRHLASGALDTTFGSNGMVIGAVTEGRAVSIQPDGRIVTTGKLSVAGDVDFAVQRLLARSSLKKGRSISPRNLLAPTQMAVPPGSAFSMSVASTSRKVCAASRGVLRALAPGTCKVTVSVRAKRSRTNPTPTLVRVPVTLTVTS